MKDHHIITPLNRIQNFSKLVTLLEPQKIQWHVISDLGSTVVETDIPWVHSYVCPNVESTFWGRCNYAINWFLNHHALRPNGMYSILNDDDAYMPGYFDKLREQSHPVIITSMQRGNKTPKDVIPERAHGTNTLVAAPENMKVGHVGVEQISVSGQILKNCRLPIHICGDGQMIEYIIATQSQVVYLPECYVWFNYLEPGRWE